MSPRIVVAYASRAGSIAEVAETIGQILRDGGMDVDVRSVAEVRDPSVYDAVVLGSAIWAGKPLPGAMRFATAQEDWHICRVAYFVLCDTLKDDTAANRERALAYLDPLVAIKDPVSLGLFAGARDFNTLHPFLRWLLKYGMRLAEGDWRDSDQIRAWAADLPAQLAAEGRAVVATM